MPSLRSSFGVMGIACVLGMAIFVGVFPGLVVRAGSQGAYFTSVLATDGNGQRQVLAGGVAKVYSGQAPVFEDTVFFNNITSVPSSVFYEVIFVSSGLTTISFTGDPLAVASRSSGSFNWQESGGFVGSGGVHIRLELWLNSSGTPVLESVVQFDFLVVLLVVGGWAQSQATVQRGLNVPIQLALNFTDGGNDAMYNSTLALVNPSGLMIQPYAYSLGNLQVGQSASAFFNVSAAQGTMFGPVGVLFRVSFADFRGVRHATNETAVINLAQMGTQVSIVPSAPRVSGNGYVSIKILLVDNNANPVADSPITVYIGNLPALSLQTDSFGKAVYQYQARNGSGVYLLRATYAGSLSLAPSVGSSILIVNPIGTALTLAVPRGLSLGHSTSLSATLLDETGHPVVGANITFIVNGRGVGWVLTDASGVAVLYYYLGRSGNLNVRASYLGDAVYAGAESSVATVSVAPVSLLVIGGVDLTLPTFLAFAFSILILAARSLKAHREV